MRVVLLTFGGYAYYPHLLIQSLLGLEKGTRVFAPISQRREYQEILGDTFRVSFFKKPRMRYPTNLLLAYRLAMQIRDYRADLVHMLGYYPWMYFGLCCIRRTPLVMTVHDPIRHTGDTEAVEFPFPSSWFYRRSAEIIVLSEGMKKAMEEAHGMDGDRIHTILHGNLLVYLRWAKEGVTETGNQVLFFGRIYPYKGLEYLVEAEKIVSKIIPEVRFVVAGTGHEEYILEAQRKIKHPDRFLFLHQYIPDELAARLFQESSVIVLPYTDATQSGVIPMAYAFKRPVIATNVGGLGEYVRHGISGYLVPPKDPESLASRIIDLLNKPGLRRAMGEEGYRMSLDVLSWEKIGKQTLDLYRKVCGRGIKGRP